MKQFGIRTTLPMGNPMTLPHLLGPDWESVRWFDSEQARNQAFDEMQRDIVYYRQGDRPSRILAKIER
jgi:hypothetical protein